MAENTEQFNIRVNKDLLRDLDFIAGHININRNDWIRLVLAKTIVQTKEKIIGKFEYKYLVGLLTNKEYKEQVGVSPSEGMKELRGKAIKDKEKEENRLKLYFQSIGKGKELKKDSKAMYYDPHLSKIMKKIDKKKN